MKELTKEQLAAYVTDSMDKVFEENAAKIRKSVKKPSEINNVDEAYANMEGYIRFQVLIMMQEYNRVLVETLDHVLNNE